MPGARILHVDLETRSCVDLRKAGAHRYAEDPSTTIVCGSYRFDDGPVRSWIGTDIPWEVRNHILDGLPMAGHNQQFERVILAPHIGYGHPKPEQQDCTMARGLAVGLPASLEQMGEALGAKVQKDREGHRLMMQMCRPRSVQMCDQCKGSGEEWQLTDEEAGAWFRCSKCKGYGLNVEWWDDAERVQRLSAYCDQDVLAECAIDALVPKLSDRERRVWELDQRINDRGFCVDLPTVQKALAAVDAASKAADREIWRLTDGAVKRCTEVAKIVAWVETQGVPCKSVAKGEIDDLIIGAEVFDKPAVADVVRLRRATARSSTAKYKAMLDSVCRDGRIRGTLNYHRAHTGRWGGSGVQPQNFPRVDNPDAVGRALEALRTYEQPVEIVTAIDLMAGPPIEVLSKCLRAMIVAAPGCELLGGDFSQIEVRLAAWINNETWMLDAFRAFDAGEGPDLYRVQAAAITGKDPEDVTGVERQVKGKVPILACIYQGALGAFQKMAFTQDPPVRVADAEAKGIVSLFRDRNLNIVQGWWELQDAAIEAVGAPGCVVYARGNKVAYTVNHGFLWCLLPSGRVIAYVQPRLVWTDKEIKDADGDTFTVTRRCVEYMGVDSFTKRWSAQSLYGGMQMNHVVQGTARDRMVDAMFHVEDAGLPLVLTVHDELLSEVPEGIATAEQYAELMMREPAWSAGLPVAVKTWKDVRYVK